MSDELAEIKSLLEGINAKLTRLEDIEEVRNLIVNYARGCDRGNDPEIIGPLFAEDGSWEGNGFGKYRGRERVAKGLKGIAGEKIWWSLHYMISPQITIDPSGETGKAFWYLWESATVPNPHTDEAEAHWIGGTYDVSVIKIDGKWYFKDLKLDINMVSPYGDGWVKAKYLDGSKNTPFMMNLDAGTYYWCSCGRSKTQPFCDGSHAGTKREPIKLVLEERQQIALCGCKYSRNKPYCDGAHFNHDFDNYS